MKTKKGMALPIVLIFAAIMGIVSVYLLRNTRGGNAQNQTSMDQLQSYYIARAGVEHAMVKVKYLNQELYDAMCMQQGRSALFDYSQIKNPTSPGDCINEFNPGPIFLYTYGTTTPVGVNSNMQGKTGGLASSTWINVFKLDLCSDYASTYASSNIYRILDGAIKKDIKQYNSILDMSDVPNEIKKIQNQDPKIKDVNIFQSAAYNVTDIKVAAAKVEEKTKLDNRYVIEFTVKSSYTTARNVNFDYKIDRILQVSRDLR